MLALSALPQRYLDLYGKEKVMEITEGKPGQFALWVQKNSFPLAAVEKLLAFDPAPIHELRPLYHHPEFKEKLMILVPLSGPPAAKMMDSLIKLYNPQEMKYERFAFNNLSVSRNVLAARFLRSDAQWAFWMDGDMLLPCGDAAWFKREAGVPKMADTFAGLHSIYRMLVHQKTIVSCCYIARRAGGPGQFGGAERQFDLKRGPKDALIEAPWSGMGGMLTHRSVFTDIVKTMGDEIKVNPDGGMGKRFNYSHAFFHPLDVETCGDDLPFSFRAAKAGHKTHIDLAVQAAHVGDRAYTYADL